MHVSTLDRINMINEEITHDAWSFWWCRDEFIDTDDDDNDLEMVEQPEEKPDNEEED